MSTDTQNTASQTTELETAVLDNTVLDNTVLDNTVLPDAATAGIDGQAPRTSDPVEGPRIRWAAIVWGLLFAAIAFTALRTILSPESREAFAAWAFALSPTTVTLYALFGLGSLVLVAGLVGLLRRAQRRRTRA